MVKSLLSFLSGLFSFINRSKDVELGRFKEKEHNRFIIQERKRIINEIDKHDNITRLSEWVRKKPSDK